MNNDNEKRKKGLFTRLVELFCVILQFGYIFASLLVLKAGFVFFDTFNFGKVEPILFVAFLIVFAVVNFIKGSELAIAFIKTLLDIQSGKWLYSILTICSFIAFWKLLDIVIELIKSLT